MIHSFDLQTMFCTRCGKAVERVVSDDCDCREGVLAISHIVAKRRTDRELKGTVLEYLAQREARKSIRDGCPLLEIVPTERRASCPK